MFRVKGVLFSVVLAVILIAPAFAFSGCNDDFVDDSGAPIRIGKIPERVCVNAPSITELIFELGMGNTIIGVTEYDTFPDEVNDITKYGFGDNFSVEDMLMLNCDVLFVSKMSNSADNVKLLRDNGINVVVFEADNLAETYSVITRLGRIFGKEDKAKQIVSVLKAGLSAVKEAVKNCTRRTAYFEISPLYMGSTYTVGGAAFGGEILEICNLENIFKNEKLAWAPVSQEQIIIKNPYCIITNDPYSPDPAADIKGRTGWDAISAVVNDRIYIVDVDQSSRTTSRLVLFAKDLAKQAHGVTI